MQAAADRLRTMKSERVTEEMQPSRQTFAAMHQAGISTGIIAKTTEPNPAFKKFEAFMLQSFVESMFAGDDQAVYGKGIAGDYWKSMMSEAIAGEMAQAGGIGIARMLEQQSAKRASDETGAAANGDARETDGRAALDQGNSNVISHRIERNPSIRT
ncbi:MAG: rod-binding protein [Alphaproteobacteria bacterium]